MSIVWVLWLVGGFVRWFLLVGLVVIISGASVGGGVGRLVDGERWG
jgi:hypothetical protein